MTTTYEHKLQVSGALMPGNVHADRVTISPTANSPTSTTVSGFSLTGTGDVSVQLTPYTSVPGDVVEEVTYTSKSSTGFTIYIYRTTDTDTFIYYFIIKKP